MSYWSKLLKSSGASLSCAVALSAMLAPAACGSSAEEGPGADTTTADGGGTGVDASESDAASPRCGDGVKQAGEECDDGNQVNADACTNACKRAKCGDKIKQPGEGCDDGNEVNDDACTNACKAATCGDGIKQADEECDDGNQVNDDACTNACTAPKCGDKIKQAGEECDDGNADETDACTSTCKNAKCGDGFTQAGVEECDDANAVDTDACTSACKSAKCGDAFIQAGTEDCDGANLGTATCMSQGFLKGTLACSDACKFDTAMCSNNPCPNDGAYVSNRCWYASTVSETTATKCAAQGLTGAGGFQALTWDQTTLNAVAAGLNLVAGGKNGCCVEFGWIENGTLYTHNFGAQFYNWDGDFGGKPTLKACNPPAP